ncbi:hypothetical protein [Nocardia africana]
MSRNSEGEQPIETPAVSPSVVEERRREVLNYFGNCPRCGYTAHAFLVATHYADGRTVVGTIGSCGVPCGWSGPITLTKMTEPH